MALDPQAPPLTPQQGPPPAPLQAAPQILMVPVYHTSQTAGPLNYAIAALSIIAVIPAGPQGVPGLEPCCVIVTVNERFRVNAPFNDILKAIGWVK